VSPEQVLPVSEERWIAQLGMDLGEALEDHRMPLEQERERMNRLCKLILAETDPETFDQLTQELDELAGSKSQATPFRATEPAGRGLRASSASGQRLQPAQITLIL
jgi:hypothetical protein